MTDAANIDFQQSLVDFSRRELRRPGSAPCLSSCAADAEAEAELEAETGIIDELSFGYRCSADYAEWYYSQHPRDPRLLRPLHTTSTELAILCAKRGGFISVAASAARLPPALVPRVGSPVGGEQVHSTDVRDGVATPPPCDAEYAAPSLRGSLPCTRGERSETEGLSTEHRSCLETSSGGTRLHADGCSRLDDDGETCSPADPDTISVASPPRRRSGAECSGAGDGRTSPSLSASAVQHAAVPEQPVATIPDNTPAACSRPLLPSIPTKLNVGAAPFVPSLERLELPPLPPPDAPGTPFQPQFDPSQEASTPSRHQVEGKAAQLATDQEGSRILQRRIDVCDQEELGAICAELVPHAFNLMQDVFGNHVLQKIIDRGGPSVHQQLYGTLQGRVMQLTTHPFGCRIVQKCIDVLPPAEREQIARELEGNVAKCIQDQNGNHVIQKCIESMPDQVGFIVQAFVGRVSEFATHAYGCRCVQRLLEHCKSHQEIVPILEEVLHNIHNLVTDQYGNYVVQHVLTNGHPQYQFAITSKLRGCYTLLSTHKFASNVIEKMFEYAPPQVRVAILEEMMDHRREDGNTGLVGAVMDQYGNFVIQKIFDICTPSQRQLIMSHLYPYSGQLRQAPYAKHFVGRLDAMGALEPAYTGRLTSNTTTVVQQSPQQFHPTPTVQRRVYTTTTAATMQPSSPAYQQYVSPTFAYQQPTQSGNDQRMVVEYCYAPQPPVQQQIHQPGTVYIMPS